MTADDPHRIASLDQLAQVYDAATSKTAAKKIDHIDKHCQAIIAASPFMLLATSSEEGADCTPRGDPPGFVQVADRHTLLIPDRRGNNLLDSLRNVVLNPEVGLLFLVPGMTETLRVNGTGHLTTDPEICARFEMQGALPRSVLVVSVREAYLHCPRAILRADLWNPERYVDRASLPTMGRIFADHIRISQDYELDADAYDAQAKETLTKILY